MNLSELIAKFHQDIREPSSNTRFNSTEVTSWLNEGYKKLLLHFDLQDTEREVLRTNVYTNCSDAGTSTGTTLYVDSVAGMTVGQCLYVWGDTTMERVYIASISSLTVTLVSPGLVNSYTDGDYVASNQVWLPVNYSNIIAVTFEESTTTEHSVYPLKPQTQQHQIFKEGTTLQAYGQPTHYWIGELDRTSELSLTASGGTNTTTIVQPTLAGTVNDYYNDWYVENQTHTGHSRVTDYVASTKTLTISPAITSQTTSDVFNIIRMLRPLNLNVVPDAQYNFWIKYNAMNSDLVNNWDTPIFDELHHEVLVKYAIYKANLRSYNPQDAEIRFADFKDFVKDMEKRIWYPTDGSLSWRTANDIIENKTNSFFGR